MNHATTRRSAAFFTLAAAIATAGAAPDASPADAGPGPSDAASPAAVPVNPADLDRNRILNVNDVQLFVDAFLADHADADITGEGSVDISDVGAFIGWFRTGYNGDDGFPHPTQD